MSMKVNLELLVIYLVLTGFIDLVSCVQQKNQSGAFAQHEKLKNLYPSNFLRIDFLSDCFRVHNAYRAKHNVRPVQFQEHLQAYARGRARELARTDKFAHLENSPYGENLWMCSGCTDLSCNALVKAWYDEINLYDYSDPKFSEETGHFTAMVWKEVRFMGCALSRSDRAVYFNCQYDPWPNVQGKFKENVLPALKTD